jgi:hypothetical protein
MIDGMFERNSLVMVAGAPGSFKSFLALDWILHLSSGRRWLDRETTPAKCLYILGEGRSSLLKRIHAWCRHHQVTNDEVRQLRTNFRVTFNVPQFSIPAELTDLLSTLASEAFIPDLIVIDTFARSFVGLDENSSRDTGMWISAAEQLRSLGYTVVFLHHTRKNTEFGVQFRGSTAISGAMDTIMTVVRDWGHPNEVEVRVTKQKDHDEGEPLHFARSIIPLETDPKGSCVLIPIDPREMNVDEAALKLIIADPALKTLGERGKALATHLNISPSAGKTRVARYLKKVEKPTTDPTPESD